ncbi:MAG: DUF2285 domain-containing protein [Candidatus Obscuribacterales bacterium]|nr:DUF2285 domain-containing protein [Candidatus Obscuribacterales bacterium]
MTKAKTPEWLPDWRDPSLYPDPKVAPENQWQWEFLRRNSEYQNDYDALKSTGKHKMSQEIAEKYGCLGNRLFDPSDARYKIVADVDDDTAFGMVRKFEIKKGSLILISNLHNARKFMNGEGRNQYEHARRFSDPERYQTVIVDMRKPLSDQLRVIETMLKGRQKSYVEKNEKAPVSSDKFLRLLRTWDALQTGASPLEIVKELNGKDLESDNIDAITDEVMQDSAEAQLLIDGGYLDIALDIAEGH